MISKAFAIKSTVQSFPAPQALFDHLQIRRTDLIVTEERVFQNYLSALNFPCRYLITAALGRGPNSTALIAKAAQVSGSACTRVIAIGGGSTLELGKLLSLERLEPLNALFEDEKNIIRARTLILVPTTPGTGSEVTPFAAVFFEDLGRQLVLTSQKLCADEALLCPAFLDKIPFTVFAASSLDAFTHAVESYLSPLATPLSRTIAKEAMQILCQSWQEVVQQGSTAFDKAIPRVQMAGTMAGISYANAGCAAVHALSYPLSVRLKIRHGEANYLVIKKVLDLYEKKNPDGALMDIKLLLSPIFNTTPDQAFAKVDELCASLLPRKRLSSYGMTESQILEFTDLVLTRQNLLIANGYVPLSASEIADIYRQLL